MGKVRVVPQAVSAAPVRRTWEGQDLSRWSQSLWLLPLNDTTAETGLALVEHRSAD